MQRTRLPTSCHRAAGAAGSSTHGSCLLAFDCRGPACQIPAVWRQVRGAGVLEFLVRLLCGNAMCVWRQPCPLFTVSGRDKSPGAFAACSCRLPLQGA